MPTTVMMGAGIAIMQPAIPPLVRDWMPDRIGFGTAVYINGLLVSEIIAVALTIPIVLPLAGGSWRVALVIWAMPVARHGAACRRALRRARGRPLGARRAAALVAELARSAGVAARPAARQRQYDLLERQHVPAGLSASRSAGRSWSAMRCRRNGAQLPGSLLMLALAGRLVRRAFAPISRCGRPGRGERRSASCFAGGDAIVWWAGLLGFAMPWR